MQNIPHIYDDQPGDLEESDLEQDGYLAPHTAGAERAAAKVEELVQDYFIAYPKVINITYAEDIAIQRGQHPAPKTFGQYLLREFGSGENIVNSLGMSVEDIVAIFWRTARQEGKLKFLLPPSTAHDKPFTKPEPTRVAQPEETPQYLKLGEEPAVTMSKVLIVNMFNAMKHAEQCPIVISEPAYEAVLNGNYEVLLPAQLESLHAEITSQLKGDKTLARHLIWEMAVNRQILMPGHVLPSNTYSQPTIMSQPKPVRQVETKAPTGVNASISHSLRNWMRTMRKSGRNSVITLTEAHYNQWLQHDLDIPIPRYIDPNLEEKLISKRLSQLEARVFFWERVQMFSLAVEVSLQES